jgi:hypothetical protein
MRFNALVIVVVLNIGLISSAWAEEYGIPTVYLPRPSETVPGIRIGWFINNFKGAAQAAQSQKKMLVVVFREDQCAWCALQLAHVFRCEAFNELAGHAIFDMESPSVSPDGRALENNLGIASYPTISVMTFKGNHINERERLIGFSSLPKLLPVLKKSLMLGNGPLYTGSKAAKLSTKIYYGEPIPYCGDDVEKHVHAQHYSPKYRP